MKAGERYLYYDGYSGKYISVKLFAILKTIDAENKEHIGDIKYWVQENDLTSGFFVEKDELKEI